MSDALLSARALTKSFGATPALRGAGVEIGRGEIVAIMGPSGSGKSTLLHCMAGILTPDSGEVEFDGERIDRMSVGERTLLRRRAFGFVFQFGQLVPELTIAENVMLPLLLAGVRRRSARAQAARWLGRLDVADIGGQMPAQVSGGQAQRAAVARSLVASPRVVFADEPTGALDSVNGDRVMELLTAEAREGGTAVVVVTHAPRVAAFADREVLVRDGATAALGVPA